MGYRTREERYVAILENAKEGLSKSHIMYKAFLCYEQFVKDISELLKTDLIQYHMIEKKYHTTQRGREFLEMRSKFLCAPSTAVVG